ncbi:MAG: DNA starvation/stationary phase protection protein Dps [Oscillatoriophycideae cyanobacterium NC_groundwater_1537_Pr4_S-0.65um_50_18]|nr:DNA starvation/stationary phase protection protein Dps [Oscillatoriophycideae cyanobacterium NC_groundwater_1537_Pr4_S-0.65um_50_18]
MGSNGRSQQMHYTRIDLSQDIRVQVIAFLNQSLASTLDLKTQVKQAHWNVKGMDFYQLHSLFDEMASELEEFVDMVAERVTALGGMAMGTARIAASRSILPEFPFDILEGQDFVTALADRYAMYAKEVREAIDSTNDLGDADTADLYTEISRAIDKRLWFLEAHLQTSVETVSLNGTADSPVEVSKSKKARAKK